MKQSDAEIARRVDMVFMSEQLVHELTVLEDGLDAKFSHAIIKVRVEIAANLARELRALILGEMPPPDHFGEANGATKGVGAQWQRRSC